MSDMSDVVRRYSWGDRWEQLAEGMMPPSAHDPRDAFLCPPLNIQEIAALPSGEQRFDYGRTHKPALVPSEVSVMRAEIEWLRSERSRLQEMAEKFAGMINALTKERDAALAKLPHELTPAPFPIGHAIQPIGLSRNTA